MADGQRAQQGLIEKREDGRIGPNAKRKRQYGNHGKDRRLAHLPQT
jgi:hypothetical protein